ncbi:hypothetical protein SNEBB_004609 [Seison nebaliae]|nr:hypothetical protein SNEBB_004609 [Seison nebaliae]
MKDWKIDCEKQIIYDFDSILRGSSSDIKLEHLIEEIRENLQLVSIYLYNDIDEKKKRNNQNNNNRNLSDKQFKDLSESLKHNLISSNSLKCLFLENILFQKKEKKKNQKIIDDVGKVTAKNPHIFIKNLSVGILNNASLSCLIIDHMNLSDRDVEILCGSLKPNNNSQNEYINGNGVCLTILSLINCNINDYNIKYICQLLKSVTIMRYGVGWQNSLRRGVIFESAEEMIRMGKDEEKESNRRGLTRLCLNSNKSLSDVGVELLLECIVDDVWLKVLELQNCSLTNKSLNKFTKLFSKQPHQKTTSLIQIDLRNNSWITKSCDRLRDLCNENRTDTIVDKNYEWLSSEIDMDKLSKLYLTTPTCSQLLNLTTKNEKWEDDHLSKEIKRHLTNYCKLNKIRNVEHLIISSSRTIGNCYIPLEKYLSNAICVGRRRHNYSAYSINQKENRKCLSSLKNGFDRLECMGHQSKRNLNKINCPATALIDRSLLRRKQMEYGKRIRSAALVKHKTTTIHTRSISNEIDKRTFLKHSPPPKQTAIITIDQWENFCLKFSRLHSVIAEALSQEEEEIIEQSPKTKLLREMLQEDSEDMSNFHQKLRRVNDYVKITQPKLNYKDNTFLVETNILNDLYEVFNITQRLMTEVRRARNIEME